MSALPTSFLHISLSNRKSTWSIHTARNQLTRSALFDFLCRDRNNGKHLDHDFDYYVCHPRGWWHFDICLQTSEEVFHALEDCSESVLTIRDGLSRLGEFG